MIYQNTDSATHTHQAYQDTHGKQTTDRTNREGGSNHHK